MEVMVLAFVLREAKTRIKVTFHHISIHQIVTFRVSTGHGVYISRIEEGSVAERAGLRPGDTILEVNGTPFTKLTHEEALKVNFSFSFFINYNFFDANRYLFLYINWHAVHVYLLFFQI